MKFDPRILTVEIEFEDGSRVYSSPMNITISGSKTIASAQNTCTIAISNMKKEERDYIMSNCNQSLAASYKIRRVRVMAGRESKGSWKVFLGDIVGASVSQAPDVTITLRAQTNARDKTQWWAFSNTGPVTLERLVQDTASILGLSYKIDSKVDKGKIIPRYTFNGVVTAMIVRISELANVRCYVDDDTLVVTDWAAGLSNTIVEVNKDSGMIGIPEFTEYGIRVKTLADRNIVLGGAIRLNSFMVPVMNADYVITRLDYDLTSREQAFYYDVWANRSG